MRTKKFHEWIKHTEDPGVNIINAIHGNPQEPTYTNDNNTPKAETVHEFNAEEDKNENE